MSEEYERKSDIVEIKEGLLETEFRIQGEWRFSLPEEYSYEVDSEYDDGIPFGCDVSGAVKPLVIKCRLPGSGSPVEIAVQKHYDMMGKYYSVEDCKWDNREGQDGFIHEVLTDRPELYVDQYTESYWPMAVFEGIRVRGTNITGFDFQTNIIRLDEADRAGLHHMMTKLAYSIESCDSAAENGSGCRNWGTGPVVQPHPYDAAPQSNGEYRISGTVLKGYRGNDRYLDLPEGITEIGDHGFSGNQQITSVWIPEGVLKIGTRAFENCLQLQTVHLPDSLESIGSYAFSDCHALDDLELPENVSSIGISAFMGCTQLENIYIPEQVTEILDNLLEQTPFEGCPELRVHLYKGSYADWYCQKHGLPILYEGEAADSDDCESDETSRDLYIEDGVLIAYLGNEEHVFLPDTVREIGDYAFSSKEHLRRIELPEGLQRIGKCAFSFCKRLGEICLPDSLEEIGESAFSGCESLESLSIPPSVQRMGKDIFLFCGLLKDIFIPASVTCADGDCFSGCRAAIHTPEGSPAYRMALNKGYCVRMDLSAEIAENVPDESDTFSETAAEEAVADGNFSGMDIEGNRLVNLSCTPKQ